MTCHTVLVAICGGFQQQIVIVRIKQLASGSLTVVMRVPVLALLHGQRLKEAAGDHILDSDKSRPCSIPLFPLYTPCSLKQSLWAYVMNVHDFRAFFKDHGR